MPETRRHRSPGRPETVIYTASSVARLKDQSTEELTGFACEGADEDDKPERERERERERVGMVIEYTVTVAVPRANDGSERVVDVEL
jgi:hypothetical protein